MVAAAYATVKALVVNSLAIHVLRQASVLCVFRIAARAIFQILLILIVVRPATQLVPLLVHPQEQPAHVVGQTVLLMVVEVLVLLHVQEDMTVVRGIVVIFRIVPWQPMVVIQEVLMINGAILVRQIALLAQIVLLALPDA
jgi:hypothetical protein